MAMHHHKHMELLLPSSCTAIVIASQQVLCLCCFVIFLPAGSKGVVDKVDSSILAASSSPTDSQLCTALDSVSSKLEALKKQLAAAQQE